LIEIINKQLLLQLVGYLCYWQMGFNSVFKGLNVTIIIKDDKFQLERTFSVINYRKWKGFQI